MNSNRTGDQLPSPKIDSLALATGPAIAIMVRRGANAKQVFGTAYRTLEALLLSIRPRTIINERDDSFPGRVGTAIALGVVHITLFIVFLLVFLLSAEAGFENSVLTSRAAVFLSLSIAILSIEYIILPKERDVVIRDVLILLGSRKWIPVPDSLPSSIQEIEESDVAQGTKSIRIGALSEDELRDGYEKVKSKAAEAGMTVSEYCAASFFRINSETSFTRDDQADESLAKFLQDK